MNPGLCCSAQHHIAGCKKNTVALLLQGPHVPVGLNNLGNICYANSALQTLFMIPRLRGGLFAVEEPLGSSDVLLQIRWASCSTPAPASKSTASH